jgi:hypothetical protein
MPVNIYNALRPATKILVNSCIIDNDQDSCLPRNSTVYINADNKYAEFLLEKSGVNRICEGIYELNLNLAYKLDRVKQPGLAMVVDFFRFVNFPEKFQLIVNEITDAKIRADAQKLADIVAKYIRTTSLSKVVINRANDKEEYVNFDTEELKKVVGAGEFLFEMEQKQLRAIEALKKRALRGLVKEFEKNSSDVHVEYLLGATTDILLQAQGKTLEEAYDIYLKSLFETAKSMLNEGKSIAEIIESTELSYRSIEMIKYNLDDEIEEEYFENLKNNAW